MELNQYYVYLHIRLDSAEPFYVGKGKDNRCKVINGRSELWKNIVNKCGYDIILLEENLTEEDSLKKEIYWIDRIGRKDLGMGTLINMNDGGEGTSGYRHLEQHKKKISESKIGRNRSEETRNKISEGNKGKKRSEYTKRRMSEGKKGKTSNRKGEILSEETKRKMSDSRILYYKNKKQ